MPNGTNTLELTATHNGAEKALLIDGREHPGQVALAALRQSMRRSGRIRIWAERPAVVVDQVGNEVRWKLWEGEGWRELWFLRSDVAAAAFRVAGR